MKKILALTLLLAGLASSAVTAQSLMPSGLPPLGLEERGVSLGYEGLSISGSTGKFSQYRALDERSSLGALEYNGLLGGGQAMLQTWIVGDTERNGIIRYYPSFGRPGSIVRLTTDYTKFADRRELFPVLTSFTDAERRNAQGTAWFTRGGAVSGVELGFSSSSRSTSDVALLLPDYGFTDLFARAIGEAGVWGFQGLTEYSRFSDATGSISRSRISHTSLLMERPVGQVGSLGLGLKHFSGDKNLDGTHYAAALKSTEAYVDYIARPTETVSVRASLKHWNRSQPITQTAYASRLTRAAVDARWYALPNLNLYGGFQVNSVRYLQVADGAASSPDYNVLWGRLRYRPTDRLSVWGNYRRRLISDQPAEQLQPRELVSAEARLSYELTDRISLETSRSRNRVYNPARGVDYWQDVTTASVVSPITNRLSVTADLSSYNWTSGSNVLGLYLTDEKLADIAFSYIIAPGFTTRLGFGKSNNTGVIDEDRSYWYAAAEHRISVDRSLGLRIGSSHYNDDTFHFNDYRAGGILLTLTNRL